MDQKIVIHSRADVSESSFISKVFMWMAAGLGVSALASTALLGQPALLRAIFSNQILFFGIIIAEFGLVLWLSAAALRLSVASATLLYIVYSALNGITLTSIFFIYTAGSILVTFAVTAGTFFFFSLYGLTTKRDLTSVGNLARMALLGFIIASVVNIFLKSSAMGWILTFLGIAIFLGLIAYDTQKLKAIHAYGLSDAETGKKTAILGALVLYLDFINLFLLLLRLFGSRRE